MLSDSIPLRSLRKHISDNMTDPATLRAWDNEHVWHPFSPMRAYREEDAPIIVEGKGFDLIDAEGNRYLDGISSLWCNVHGHRVPEIDDAIKAQVDRIGHSTLLGLSSGPSIELAKVLADITPEGLSKVFYSDSGATAVEAALKIAYQYQHLRGETQRDRFVCLTGAYHGDTIGSVSLGGIDLFHRVYRHLIFETISVPSPVAYRVPEGFTHAEYLDHCADELEHTLRQQQDRIVGVVIEPLVQGAAGILVHPEGYLKRLRELTTELGLILIADEVAVGFGRTGTLFACEQESITPDILCLAKGLTGGYLPVAATLTTDAIYDQFLGEPHEGRTLYHGHTFTGNPIGCAAALASWELFRKRDVMANVRRNVDVLTNRLRPLADHPHVGEIRQKGLMIGIELVADRDRKTPFDPVLRMGHRVTLAARRRGLILRPLGDVIVLMPAPGMPTELVERLCDLTFASIDEAVSSVVQQV